MIIGINISVPSARDLRDLVEMQIVVKHAAEEILGKKLVPVKDGSQSQRRFYVDADASSLEGFKTETKRRLGSSYRVISAHVPAPVLNIALLPH